MFSASVWVDPTGPEDVRAEPDEVVASRRLQDRDHTAFDGVPYFDDEDDEGDLEAERERELLLLKAYTGQLDEELAPQPSANETQPSQAHVSPQVFQKTDPLLGVLSAPGQLMRKKARSRAELDETRDSDSTSSDSHDSEALDDLKLGRRNPFAPSAKRRKMSDIRHNVDSYVIGDDSDDDEGLKITKPRSRSEATPQPDVLLDASNALHAEYGQAPLIIESPPRGSDGKKSRDRDDAIQIGEGSDDELVMPTVVDNRKPSGGGSSSRYFEDTMANVTCFKCGQKGHVSSDCDRKQKMCFLCGQPEHAERRCPNTLCFKCCMPGHSQRDCTNPRAPQAVCNRCGRTGHSPLFCGDANRLARHCFNCGGQGHVGTSCPLPRMDEFARTVRDRPRDLWQLVDRARRRSLEMEQDWQRRDRREREVQAFRDRVREGNSSRKHEIFDDNSDTPEYDPSRPKQTPRNARFERTAPVNQPGSESVDSDLKSLDSDFDVDDHDDYDDIDSGEENWKTRQLDAPDRKKARKGGIKKHDGKKNQTHSKKRKRNSNGGGGGSKKNMYGPPKRR